MRELNTARTRQKDPTVYPAHTEDGMLSYYRDSDGSLMFSPSKLFEGSDYLGMSVPGMIMNDTDTPDFAARMRNGEVIMNDMRQESSDLPAYPAIEIVNTQQKVGYTMVKQYCFSPDKLFGSVLFHELPPETNIWLDAEFDMLVTRLHAKVNESSANLLVSAAELHKSVRSIHRVYTTIWKLLKGLRNVRRLRLRGSITAAQAADAYLEIRYGLRPMYYEVMGIIEAINKIGTNKRSRLFVESNGPEPIWSESGTLRGSSSSYANAEWYYNYESCTQWTMSAGAILELHTPKNGLIDVTGLSDIVEAGWELVPFSFVVDWFLNTGKLFSSLDVPAGMDILGTWATVEETATRRIHLESFTAIGDINAYSDISDTGTMSKRTRTRRLANPVKPFLPKTNIRLDGLKILDLLALFGGLATDLRRWRI